MAIRLDLASEATVTDSTVLPGTVRASVKFDAFKTTKRLDATTTPAVEKHTSYTVPLVAGAATIDLTSLPDPLGSGTITLAGLKVQSLKFKAASTNTAKITVSKGASNGLGKGSAGDTWTSVIVPGGEELHYMPEGTPDVAGGAKTIDLAGTGTESLEVTIVAG